MGASGNRIFPNKEILGIPSDKPNGILELGRQEVVNEPKVQRVLGVVPDLRIQLETADATS